jgi:glycosyltransferase involved in cell wall biosynthesis
MYNPIISIIIPTFNREAYIGYALDSIVRQTYAHWECIVVDDGGSDDTLKIVSDFCENDARISFYKRSQDYPKGVNGARNFGLDKSKGEYIALCDDDDYWLEDKLEKQMAVFKAHPEIGLVTGNIEYVNTDGKRTGRIIKHVGNHGRVFENFLLKNRTSAITPLFKRAVVEQVGKFNTDFKIFEDWEYWRRVSYYYPFYALTDVLACVRKHDTNTSLIITDDAYEQFVRYRALTKALLMWGTDRFNKADRMLIAKVEARRYKQLLRNHCPGFLGKLKFIIKVFSFSLKEGVHLLYLIAKYGV